MRKYAITDPKFYIDFAESFSRFSHLKEADFILLRDKSCFDYGKKAREFIKFKNSIKARFIIHNDADLALKLGFYGVHFTSSNFSALKKAANLSLYKIISTHSFKEALMAYELGADAIVLSPIFKTPCKGVPIGVENLKNVVDNINIKVFALGGIIDEEHVSLCEQAGAYGFASIRYFVK